MATTEQTLDDVSKQAAPNTVLGVALGFAGIVLIAKEKLFLGALSLVGGALIGLRSHLDQQPSAGASPLEKVPPATRRATARPAAEKQTASRPTPAKAVQKKTVAKKPTAAKTTAKKAPPPEPASAKTTAKGNLNQVEGVGPKIAEVLGAAGIQTFAQMAQTTPEQLREILAAAGNRFRFADPSTWPEQAALAAAGRWDDLKTLKGELKGGRRSG